jgi:hypothetical protein
MKTLALLSLALLGGCHQPPPPPDPETQFIATTKEWQDRGIEIVGVRATTVRTTCRHRPDIVDCKTVLSRLPQ